MYIQNQNRTRNLQGVSCLSLPPDETCLHRKKYQNHYFTFLFGLANIYDVLDSLDFVWVRHITHIHAHTRTHTRTHAHTRAYT